MAYIQERKDKNGNVISYSIRVFKGYAPDGEQLKPHISQHLSRIKIKLLDRTKKR